MPKKRFKRVTVKIGTRVLTTDENKIDRAVLKNVADQVAELMSAGTEVILVSSGAIGSGLGLLGLEKKNKTLSELQAIASIGQSYLMAMYNEYLGKRGYIAGQILLTQEDFNDRKRFLNIKYTLNTLLAYKAIPIINENDSVSTAEIKCGDNDRLSYLVSDLAGSDLLVILTNVDGLYDGEGRLVKRVEKVTDEIRAFCKGKGSDVNTGGMISKVEAAASAARSGFPCVIARGREKDVIVDIASGGDAGTRFEPLSDRIGARKRWIAYGIKAKGRVAVDDGAEKAVVSAKKSLLPSGVIGVENTEFSRGDVVEVVTRDGKVIARGLVNYSSADIEKIKGQRTDKIEKVLGCKDYDEVIHRDNLVIVE